MSVSKQGAFPAILVAALLGAPSAVNAQAELAPPRALTQTQPPQSTNAIGEPVDGWAIVRYSVLANGTTANVRVIETVPPSMDEDPIVSAVETWTFEPGTEDGDAVDWHNGESIVNFGSGDPGQPSDAFNTAYDSIVTLTEEQLFTQALDASLTLLNEQATAQVELGLAVGQLATINFLGDNPHRALRYLQLVTDERITVLPLEELFTALQLKLNVETSLGRVKEALKTYEWIAAGLDPEAADPFASVAGQLRNHWENTQFLEIKGEVGNKPWRFDIGRRYFYIDNVNGEIDSLDIECDRRRLSVDFQADADYQLPESFGACTVFVYGTPGTEFSYIAVLPQAG